MAEPDPEPDPDRTGARRRLPTEFSVEQICSRLIRIDTSNPGSGERVAAEYVAEFLESVEVRAEVIEGARGRANVVARVPGRDRTSPALLVQGHLDTVPAIRSEWSVDPLSGEIADGFVWGRGAVDMKNALAMTLAAVARMLAAGARPVRDLVLAFTADEETGGTLGARFLMERHRELFDGCGAVIGEVGGINIASPAGDGRLYVISTADKGIRRYELHSRGVPGHGSLPATDNPIEPLAAALQRIAGERLPLRLTASMRALAGAVLGREPHDDVESAEALAHHAGPMGRFLGAAVRDTVNVTQLRAGVSPNVVPAEAWALLDARFVPGHEDDLDALLLGSGSAGVTVEQTRHTPAVVSPDDAEWWQRLRSALRSVDPTARAMPFLFSGATDNKWFTALGVPTYGFTPMLVPDDFDYPAMFHGIDERVPVSSLQFGVEALTALFSL